MQKSIKVSLQDLGMALVDYIGHVEADSTFNPFFVAHSSLALKEEISVVLSNEEIRLKKAGKRTENFFPDNQIFTLSREEVLEAIADRIAIFNFASKNVKKISKIYFQLPSEIKVMLKYIPRGALPRYVEHNFDGSM